MSHRICKAKYKIFNVLVYKNIVLFFFIYLLGVGTQIQGTFSFKGKGEKNICFNFVLKLFGFSSGHLISIGRVIREFLNIDVLYPVESFLLNQIIYIIEIIKINYYFQVI